MGEEPKAYVIYSAVILRLITASYGNTGAGKEDVTGGFRSLRSGESEPKQTKSNQREGITDHWEQQPKDLRSNAVVVVIYNAGDVSLEHANRLGPGPMGS